MYKDNMNMIPATPYAKMLARQNGLDLSSAAPSGKHGEVKASDVMAILDSVTKVTPLAKRMAKEMNIDLSSIKGSGFRGKVRSKDLKNADSDDMRDRLESVMLDIDDVLKKYSMTGMRKVIAKRMMSSHTEIPVVTQNIEVDVTALLNLRKEINDSKDKANRISVNDLIIKAVAITTREQERYRMQLIDDTYVLHSVVNVGMAVGMDEGLLVPVIKHADEMNVFEISQEAKLLAIKARDNKLSPSDYGCGVITVSNIGMYGTHSFTPIINQPEASILGVNAAIDRLMMVDGRIEQHKIMMLSLTYDHRIINGTEAAAFENRMKELLEDPIQLLN